MLRAATPRVVWIRVFWRVFSCWCVWSVRLHVALLFCFPFSFCLRGHRSCAFYLQCMCVCLSVDESANTTNQHNTTQNKHVRKLCSPVASTNAKRRSLHALQRGEGGENAQNQHLNTHTHTHTTHTHTHTLNTRTHKQSYTKHRSRNTGTHRDTVHISQHIIQNTHVHTQHAIQTKTHVVTSQPNKQTTRKQTHTKNIHKHTQTKKHTQQTTRT